MNTYERIRLLEELGAELTEAAARKIDRNRKEDKAGAVYDNFLQTETRFLLKTNQENHHKLERAGLEVAYIGETSYLWQVKTALEGYHEWSLPYKSSLNDVVTMVNRHDSTRMADTIMYHFLKNHPEYKPPKDQNIWRNSPLDTVKSILFPNACDDDITRIFTKINTENLDVALQKAGIREYFPPQESQSKKEVFT